MATNNRNLIERATAIKTARLVRDHLSGADEVRKLALEDTLEETKSTRDDILEMHAAAIASQREMMGQMIELLEAIRTHIITPPVVNVPKAAITLEQQPVEVNVPAPKVNVNPKISLPAAEVVINTTKNNLPTKATIQHSDGTQSKIDFS